MIAAKVKSLLWRDLSYGQIVENRRKLEYTIEKTEYEIDVLKKKITEMKNKEKSLKEKYPKIDELKDHIEFLDPKVKHEIESFLTIGNQIGEIEKQIIELQKQIPYIETYESIKTESLRSKNLQPYQQIPTENFSTGISDEVINIIALQQGKQIILCKSHEKPNNYIFLLPKTTNKSDFEPSEKGWKMMSEIIDKDTCKYVAEIEYLPIPGKNKNFWQELYNEGEFELWDIERGPYKYFTRSSRKKMLLWIFRVYEMPFEISKNVDFKRQPHGSAKIINTEKLKKIQDWFDEGKFSSVQRDDEFEKRKKKIREIARKYS